MEGKTRDKAPAAANGAGGAFGAGANNENFGRLSDKLRAADVRRDAGCIDVCNGKIFHRCVCNGAVLPKEESPLQLQRAVANIYAAAWPTSGRNGRQLDLKRTLGPETSCVTY